MRKRFQVIVELILQTFILLAIIFSELVLYGIQQGVGQAKILLGAVPLAEVINADNINADEQRKLLLIKEIKTFAVDSLGISPSESYEKYYDQQDKPVLWVITASHPYEIKAYEWYFPFLGNVSYKGFFKEERAIAAKDELLEKGFDVDIGTVSAWSTLGWFNDPVLSSMLNRSEGGLANLIIHELTHGTIYAKSSVEFNENLASFIGDKGAIMFLKHRYGTNSDELMAYIKRREDAELYHRYMLRSANMLKDFYSRVDAISELRDKEREKMAMMESIVVGIDTLALHNKAMYRQLAETILESKNAYFVDIQMYDAKQDVFQQEYDSLFGGSNLKGYLRFLVEKYR